MSASTVIPAVCYSSCNNAYIDALRFGKTPALCSDSSFNNEYSSCRECVAANSSDPAAVNENYVEHRFEQFFQYCASLNGSSIASSIVESTTVATTLSVASSLLSSLPIFTTINLSSTSTPSGSPYATITATNTQGISLFNGSMITITFSNVITLWTQTSSISSPSTTNSQSKLTPGHAQFHGVVFGSIFGGLAIIAFGGIYCGHEKAQLHSDCISPKNPEEIDGSPKGPVAELPAIEAVAEMPGSINYLPREVG
ncbi:hypothetical protein BPOR_0012g00420 [Botrytis porri]|uniref:Uncharacterized protein n=1 Tax=Botrytis porri TaxID=87229 RepID=A0A4Z1L6C6_9HELO|nr:hypothetical protein BPOR_0012g00420 [Botrytis porri]